MSRKNRFNLTVEKKLADMQLSLVDHFLIRVIVQTNENMFSFISGVLTNISVSFLFNLINLTTRDHSKSYVVLYVIAFVLSVIITRHMFLLTIEVISIAQSLTDDEKDNYEARANALIDRTKQSIDNIRRHWYRIIAFSLLLFLIIIRLFYLNNYGSSDSVDGYEIQIHEESDKATEIIDGLDN